jgi:hypothetical protein
MGHAGLPSLPSILSSRLTELFACRLLLLATGLKIAKPLPITRCGTTGKLQEMVMDMFMPFVQRVPGTPVTPEPTTVVPVFKEARLNPVKGHETKFLILNRLVPKGDKDKGADPDAPYTTPEEDQHLDKDGHLDIFV